MVVFFCKRPRQEYHCPKLSYQIHVISHTEFEKIGSQNNLITNKENANSNMISPKRVTEYH